ncbi:response regulator [Azoarcus indigens]|uniref:Response regulator receiver domain-containing protein n=1 Tax=Azoarcus indigens TaxID=29545 RepID=A0A4R6DTD6_9RHOO|nr:response regulator [Azoarcus indigens]NMG64476.1 response regulator [Azoarcus indigens]TDN48415.1 response regulator receiver domain-containing protein [Azoarcus indigens]
MLRPLLLVEDDLNDIELTMIALEKARIANPVVSVRDGVDALDYLRREGKWADREDVNPAVILLDKKLPRLDGHDVLQTVRSDERLKRIPIVMLTSSREERDLLRSYDLGVNAYVVKPVELEDFMAAITDLGMFWAVLNEPPPFED